MSNPSFGSLVPTGQVDVDVQSLGIVEMTDGMGRAIFMAVVSIGSVIFWSVPSFFWEGLSTNVIGLAAWAGVLIATGLRFLDSQEYVVIERLGKYYRVALGGPRFFLFLGLIDKEAGRGVVAKRQRLKMYADEDNGHEIDFVGGSAPIKAQIWWQIGNPRKREPEHLLRCILAHTYRYTSPTGRLEEQVDGKLRPALQELTIDEAQKTQEKVQDSVVKNPSLLADMRSMGVWFAKKDPLIISDISVSVEDKAERRRRLTDETRGRGYQAMVQAVIDEARKHGKTLDWDAAEKFVLQLRAMEAYEGTGANATFVSPDLASNIAMLLQGQGNGGKS